MKTNYNPFNFSNCLEFSFRKSFEWEDLQLFTMLRWALYSSVSFTCSLWIVMMKNHVKYHTLCTVIDARIEWKKLRLDLVENMEFRLFRLFRSNQPRKYGMKVPLITIYLKKKLIFTARISNSCNIQLKIFMHVLKIKIKIQRKF
jgi:hypothetical protein